MPYVVGFAGVLVFSLILRIGAGRSWRSLLLGEDDRPSTSKAQLVLWTAVVIFSYLSIYAVRVRGHNFDADLAIPQNVLIAIGISGATAVSAKAIAVNAASRNGNGNGSGNGNPPAPAGNSGILIGDDGKPDLGKLQVVVWTAIAAAVYLISVVHCIHTGAPALPTIDINLMILMGLGHSVYLGKKIAES